MDNIDFDFIKENEGFELQGYVPVDKNNEPLGHSGVTIASGFDLGQRGPRDIKGFYKELKNKLFPYLVLQGKETLLKDKKLVGYKKDGMIQLDLNLSYYQAIKLQ